MRYPIIDQKKTGKNIYKLCKRKGITVNKIRVFMNFACDQTIYRWFHGRSLPSLDNFYALSTLLGVSVENLLVNDSGIIAVPGREERSFSYMERLQVYWTHLGYI